MRSTAGLAGALVPESVRVKVSERERERERKKDRERARRMLHGGRQLRGLGPEGLQNPIPPFGRPLTLSGTHTNLPRSPMDEMRGGGFGARRKLSAGVGLVVNAVRWR